MKRSLSLLLALALLTLTACSGGSVLEPETGGEAETLIRTTAPVTAETTANSGAHDPTGPAVGFARAEVSPDPDTALPQGGNGFSGSQGKGPIARYPRKDPSLRSG